uniref:Uncharacterized protein n=1 Tax=Amphiprion percula TaxID=161767 RepID=A0A3P8RRC1_AMPPE
VSSFFRSLCFTFPNTRENPNIIDRITTPGCYLKTLTQKQDPLRRSSGFRHCFSRMMWSCWLHHARTSNSHWIGSQPSVKRLG